MCRSHKLNVNQVWVIQKLLDNSYQSVNNNVCYLFTITASIKVCAALSFAIKSVHIELERLPIFFFLSAISQNCALCSEIRLKTW